MANVKKIKIGESEYGIATANKLTVGNKTFDGSSSVSIAAADLGAITNVTAKGGSNISNVGTPTVQASTSGTTTTLTFDFLKGEQGTQGINLLQGSRGFYYPWSNIGEAPSLGSDGFWEKKLLDTWHAYAKITLDLELTTYTLSFDARKDGTNNYEVLEIKDDSSNQTVLTTSYINSNTYKRYVASFTVSKNDYPSVISFITRQKANAIYIKKVKLEKGSVNNPVWTPAPADSPGIKAVESPYSETTTNLATWGTPGRSETWVVTSTANLVVGDVALIKVTNTDKNGTQFIFSTVTKINSSTNFTGISAGFLDKGETGIQGPAGPSGPQGVKGEKGETGAKGDTGPNTVSSSTSTNLSGILKGNGQAVTTAVAGTDYLTSANLTPIENRLAALEKVRNANSIAYPV